MLIEYQVKIDGGIGGTVKVTPCRHGKATSKQATAGKQNILGASFEQPPVGVQAPGGAQAAAPAGKGGGGELEDPGTGGEPITLPGIQIGPIIINCTCAGCGAEDEGAE
jgi:hypothetical protein